MVVIRLSRVGKKNSPAYRVVVADKQRAVKRKFIEVIGHYNPTFKPKEIVINEERAKFWMGKGAKPSTTVNNLMVDLSILKKSEKIKKVFGKPHKKKASTEEPVKSTSAETTVEEPIAEEAKEDTSKDKASQSESEEQIVE